MITSAFVALGVFISSVGIASAMEFRAGTWKGHQAVYGDGTIVAGDAEKLRRIAATAPAAAHGFGIILRNSPGGSVAEAFKMAEIINLRRRRSSGLM